MHPQLVVGIVALALQASPLPATAPDPAGAPGSTAADPAPAQPPPAEEVSPPPGSPAELRLWTAGVKANQAVLQVRAAAALLQTRARGADLLRRLEVAAKASGHEEGERLLTLRRRLQAAWDKDRELFTRHWPVDPTRACGYPHLQYDAAMRMAPGAARQTEVENARPDLQTCVDRARLATDAMAAANVALDAAIQDAQKALAVAEARPPRGDRDDEHERHERSEGK